MNAWQDRMKLIERLTRNAPHTSFDSMLASLFAELPRFAPCDRLAIGFVHEGTASMIMGPTFSKLKTSLPAGYREALQSPIREALFKQRICSIGDHAKYKNGPASFELLKKDGVKSSVLVPICVGEKPLGVLWLSSRRAHAFGRELEPFLQTIASQLAICLERGRMVSRQTLDRNAREQLRSENERLKEVLVRSPEFDNLIGDSGPWQKLLKKIETVADTEATILIRGETGTGKELVARAIHRLSRRKNKAFVAINCGALSPELIASELFGHERGAFTGAVQRKLGRVELAQGGTLFLDEIAELNGDLQVKLLRLLQEREFERVGGTQTIRVDVRIVAATHQNLEQARLEHRFRDDLYFRLNVIPLHVPPLRERKDDIEPLLEYFLSRFSQKMGKSFEGVDPESFKQCIAYSWPGNVRELENLVERSVILNNGPLLHFSPLDEADSLSDESDNPLILDEMISRHLTKVLRMTRGKVYGHDGAASILGLKPSTLQAKLRKHGIQRQALAD